MRTAMIAPLSCALLCGSLSSLKAYAVQCQPGQANVELRHVSLSPNGQIEFYKAEIEAWPSMRFADIPDREGGANMAMYLVTNLKKTLLLPHRAKVTQPECLEFSSSLFFEDQVTVGAPAKSIDRRIPHIFFQGDEAAGGIISFEVMTNDKHDPGKPMVTNLRVYVQGKSKDGKEFTLSDTKTPCNRYLSGAAFMGFLSVAVTVRASGKLRRGIPCRGRRLDRRRTA